MKKKLKAFTLAEVLITLAIVGVVAALTLPNLIVNYQKKQTVNRLKSTYSIFSQAFEHAKVDYGDMSEWELGPFDTSVKKPDLSKIFYDKYFLPYINVAKNYGVIKAKEIGYKSIYYPDGSSYTYLSSYMDFYTILLSNGTLVLFSFDNSSDGNTYFHPMMYVDTNGLSKPNTLGKDIFVFLIRDNKFGFYDYSMENYSRSVALRFCSGLSSNGIDEARHCGKLIQMDGWQMKDDYPW